MSAQPPQHQQQESAATTTVPALALWVVVTTALGYGVVQTLIKAAALFTG